MLLANKARQQLTGNRFKTAAWRPGKGSGFHHLIPGTHLGTGFTKPPSTGNKSPAQKPRSAVVKPKQTLTRLLLCHLRGKGWGDWGCVSPACYSEFSAHEGQTDHHPSQCCSAEEAVCYWGNPGTGSSHSWSSQEAFQRHILTDSKEIEPVLKEINPEYSLEGLMLKLKLQQGQHPPQSLMQVTDTRATCEGSKSLDSIPIGRTSDTQEGASSSPSSAPQTLVPSPEEALPVKRSELVQLQLEACPLGCIPVWRGAG